MPLVEPVVVSGSASFERHDNAYLIIQSSTSLTLDWQSFAIAAGEALTFVQPSADCAVLNRIVGPDPIAIDGTLRANGSVSLDGSAGVTFGSESVVDAFSFAATSANHDRIYMSGLVSGDTFLSSSPTPYIGGLVATSGGNVGLEGAGGLVSGTGVYIAGDTVGVQGASGGSVSTTGVTAGDYEVATMGGDLVVSGATPLAITANATAISAPDVSLIPTSTVVAPLLQVVAYAWKSHALLDAVSFPSSGDIPVLVPVRDVPVDEAVITNAAVNLQDAIAVLKMIVGLDVNGVGKPLSPYQALAADFDGSGGVNLTDAIGVLKHVVGLTAPAPAWLFVDEADTTMAARATLSPGPVTTTVSTDITTNTSVGLVGILRGDVDGSWTAPAGSTTLDTSYFSTLVATLNDGAINTAQWGIYTA